MSVQAQKIAYRYLNKVAKKESYSEALLESSRELSELNEAKEVATKEFLEAVNSDKDIKALNELLSSDESYRQFNENTLSQSDRKEHRDDQEKYQREIEAITGRYKKKILEPILSKIKDKSVEYNTLLDKFMGN